MPQIILSFEVNNQNLIPVSLPSLRAKNQNYFYAQFKINEPWFEVEGLKAVFQRNNTSYVVNLTDDGQYLSCQIPWEMMVEVGEFTVGMFGGDRLLTNTVAIDVLESCMCDGDEPIAPTEDWFAVIDNEVAEVYNAYECGELKGEKGDKGDTGECGQNGRDGVDGIDGTNGTDGADGYTPQRGIDYYTEVDKQNLITEIETDLTPEFTPDAELSTTSEHSVQNKAVTCMMNDMMLKTGILCSENSFGVVAVFSIISNNLSTVVYETFETADGIDQTKDDGADVVANLWSSDLHCITKTDSDTSLTIQSTYVQVGTSPSYMYVLCDYDGEGSIDISGSDNDGSTWTTINNGELTRLSLLSVGNKCRVRLTLNGAVRLKNIAWGVR